MLLCFRPVRNASALAQSIKFAAIAPSPARDLHKKFSSTSTTKTTNANEQLFDKKQYVFTWGDNSRGQLGLGDSLPVLLPQEVKKLSYNKETESNPIAEVQQVAAGHYHSLLRTATGEVYAWGENRDGECALEKDELHVDILVPQKSESLSSGLPSRVKWISCSRFNTLAVTKNNELYTCGRAKSEEFFHAGYETDEAIIQAPRRVPFPTTTTTTTKEPISIKMTASGWCHNIILTDEGRVFVFGYGKDGQLGLGNDVTGVVAPTPIPFFEENGKRVKHVACGLDHSVAVTEDDEVYAWGLNSFGQLGTGNKLYARVPTLVRGLCGKNVKHLSCGWAHTVALTEKGELYTFGWNEGQLGYESDLKSPVPRRIDILEGVNITQVSCGRVHTACVDDEGHLLIWGSGRAGRLGLGDFETHFTPQWVHQFGELDVETLHCSMVTCGLDHTVAVITSKQ